VARRLLLAAFIMKAIFVIAGTLGMLHAPAVAGNSKKKNREPTKPVTLVAKADAKAAIEGAEKPAEAAPATALEAAVSATPTVLDIPVLPPDTSSVLSPFPELERRPVLAAAAKPMKTSKDKAPVMKMGADYVLGRRQVNAKPDREVLEIIPRSLNQAQVATVVQSHMSDIQNCWDLVPKSHRADACTAELKLSISDAGVVTDIELGGDVPAGAHKCMTSAIAKWTFPVAETRTEIEYGISLRSL
jgi:hypothetical protein